MEAPTNGQAEQVCEGPAAALAIPPDPSSFPPAIISFGNSARASFNAENLITSESMQGEGALGKNVGKGGKETPKGGEKGGGQPRGWRHKDSESFPLEGEMGGFEPQGERGGSPPQGRRFGGETTEGGWELEDHPLAKEGSHFWQGPEPIPAQSSQTLMGDAEDEQGPGSLGRALIQLGVLDTADFGEVDYQFGSCADSSGGDFPHLAGESHREGVDASAFLNRRGTTPHDQSDYGPSRARTPVGSRGRFRPTPREEILVDNEVEDEFPMPPSYFSREGSEMGGGAPVFGDPNDYGAPPQSKHQRPTPTSTDPGDISPKRWKGVEMGGDMGMHACVEEGEGEEEGEWEYWRAYLDGCVMEIMAKLEYLEKFDFASSNELGMLRTELQGLVAQKAQELLVENGQKAKEVAIQEATDVANKSGQALLNTMENIINMRMEQVEKLVNDLAGRVNNESEKMHNLGCGETQIEELKKCLENLVQAHARVLENNFSNRIRELCAQVEEKFRQIEIASVARGKERSGEIQFLKFSIGRLEEKILQVEKRIERGIPHAENEGRMNYLEEQVGMLQKFKNDIFSKVPTLSMIDEFHKKIQGEVAARGRVEKMVLVVAEKQKGALKASEERLAKEITTLEGRCAHEFRWVEQEREKMARKLEEVQQLTNRQENHVTGKEKLDVPFPPSMPLPTDVDALMKTPPRPSAFAKPHIPGAWSVWKFQAGPTNSTPNVVEPTLRQDNILMEPGMVAANWILNENSVGSSGQFAVNQVSVAAIGHGEAPKRGGIPVGVSMLAHELLKNLQTPKFDGRPENWQNFSRAWREYIMQIEKGELIDEFRRMALFENCLCEDLKNELKLSKQENGGTITFEQFFLNLQVRYGHDSSTTARKKWQEIRVQTQGKLTPDEWRKFAIQFKLAMHEVGGVTGGEARRMLVAKLPYYAKGWVTEQENFERRYNPIFLVNFPGETNEEEVRGNLGMLVGVQPTRVISLGMGKYRVHFHLGTYDVSPAPKLLALNGKCLVGAAKGIEVAQVDASMSMEQIFDWVGTRLAGREEKDFLARGQEFSSNRRFRQVAEESDSEKNMDSPPNRSNSQPTPRGREQKNSKTPGLSSAPKGEDEPKKEEEKTASQGAGKGVFSPGGRKSKGEGGSGKGKGEGWKGGRGRDSWSQPHPNYNWQAWHEPNVQNWNSNSNWNSNGTFKGKSGEKGGGFWQKGGEKGKGKGNVQKGGGPKGN